jgi:hypothetical protein
LVAIVWKGVAVFGVNLKQKVLPGFLWVIEETAREGRRGVIKNGNGTIIE